MFIKHLIVFHTLVHYSLCHRSVSFSCFLDLISFGYLNKALFIFQNCNLLFFISLHKSHWFLKALALFLKFFYMDSVHDPFSIKIKWVLFENLFNFSSMFSKATAMIPINETENFHKFSCNIYMVNAF